MLMFFSLFFLSLSFSSFADDSFIKVSIMSDIDIKESKIIKGCVKKDNDKILFGRSKFTYLGEGQGNFFQIVWTHFISKKNEIEPLPFSLNTDLFLKNNIIKKGEEIKAYFKEEENHKRSVFFDNLANFSFAKKENLSKLKNNSQKSNFLISDDLSSSSKSNNFLLNDDIKENDLYLSNLRFIYPIYEILSKNKSKKEKFNIKTNHNMKNPAENIERGKKDIFEKNNLFHKEKDVNLEKKQTELKKRNKDDFGQEKISGSIVNASKDPPKSKKMPASEKTEITSNGCDPRIDEIHDRVIIRNKVLLYKNNKLVSESPCEDSWLNYPIKKDYFCSGCSYQWDVNDKLAYAQYKKYWLDNKGNHKKISDFLYVDKEKPFSIVVDDKACLPFIDLKNNLVYPREKLIFLGYFNEKIEIKSCYRSAKLAPIPIIWEKSDCPLIHDLTENKTIVQKKAIFLWDGTKKEASACQKKGSSLPHLWDYSVCPPKVDLNKKTMIVMARRYVLIDGEKHWANDYCEPIDSSNLLLTSDGCDGQYFHDCHSGKSYLMKRYFYYHQGKPVHVTGCLASKNFILHQIEKDGFIHNDAKNFSKQKWKTFIQSKEGLLDLNCKKEDFNKHYHKVVSEYEQPTDKYYFKKCFRFTKTIKVRSYERPDKSTYQVVMGSGRDIKGPDECIRKKEERQVFDYSVLYDKKTDKFVRKITPQMAFSEKEFLKKKFGEKEFYSKYSKVDATPINNPNSLVNRYYRKEKRFHILYPSGEKEITAWEKTGILIQNDRI